MRLPAGWAFFLAAAVWTAGGLFFERDGSDRRRGPVQADRQPAPQLLAPPLPPSRSRSDTAIRRNELPSISRFDPEIRVRSSAEKSNSVGTAFPVSNAGVWLTARHVVDGCKKVAIFTRPKKRKGFWVHDITIHPKADIAVIKTNAVRNSSRRPPAIAVAPLSEKLRAGQTGYHFGYPMGKPGDVRSQLIGRRKMRKSGRRGYVEPGIAWAVSDQSPRLEKLGGMSGGPVLNSNGRVIGITVAGNLRRGRVLTSPPITIHKTLAKAGANLDGTPSAGVSQATLNERSYAKHGDKLRRQISVAKVFCSVKG
jgi:serine protease Do